MARQDDKVAKLYEANRIRPRNASHDHFPSPHWAANKYADHEEIQANQFREDEHGPGYNNDVRKTSWLQNGDATTKPSFDKHENAWRLGAQRSNTFGKETTKVRSADFLNHHTEYERHNANGSVTHEQQAHDFSKRHIAHFEKRSILGGDDSQPVRRKYNQG